MMELYYTGFRIECAPTIYLHPLKENFELFSFLTTRHVESWAIITVDIDLLLQEELKRRGHVFYLCTGRSTLDELPAKRGFFIENITVAEAGSLADEFGQLAFVTGDVSGDAEIKFINKEKGLSREEMVLLTEVHGCIHRTSCTTGCMEREMQKLKRASISPDIADAIVSQWRENGIPRDAIREKHPFVRLWMEDLNYKDLVIRMYRNVEV